MEWLTCIRAAIDYMEAHLKDIRSPEEVANHVHVSCLYLQRGFQVLTGCTLGEYIRNRRLYLAALELKHTSRSVLDIALDWGYDTPAGFDKAFTRFHGATPKEVRGNAGIRTFLPMTVQIQISGGENMTFRIEKKDQIKVVGFKRAFNCETSYTDIPKFWDEITGKYASHLSRGEAPVGEMETFVAAHRIGELGVCLDSKGSDDFEYMIAGYDSGDGIPEGLSTTVIEAATWAVFDCTMKTLQETNTRIWKEWIPGNASYEVPGNCTVEWYSPDSIPGPDMQCQIWIPVIPKTL